ncbi:MAG TPA: hypothetical protein VM734_00540 [Kofleriaceae bacterium]|jgi:hypothetical protein|nr:hypothetical protein [Kofleriaceae bacterium]
MLATLLPLIVFTVEVSAVPAPAVPEPAGSTAPFLVAQALVDADQVVAVHEGPGVVVFDLDRASERFQLTVALDDDGAVVASTLDWVGPADEAIGVVPIEVRVLPVVDHIDWEPAGGVILRGRGRAAHLGIARSG